MEKSVEEAPEPEDLPERISTFSFVSKYEALISNQYPGRIRLRQLAGSYFGHDFTLTPTPAEWDLHLGRYKGRYSGTDVDIHGYWIFLPGARKCWQAIGRGNRGLRYWNEDNRAVGAPEDWELFSFTPVSEVGNRVKLHNSSFIAYKKATRGLDGRWASSERYFIGLTGNVFNCNERQSSAVEFYVEFV